MSSSIEDIHWQTGLFEGEGSIGILRPGPRNHGTLTASIVNTDESIVRAFADVWGGSVHHVAQRPPRNEFWRWTIAARKAQAFLLATWPCLKTDKYKERAVVGLDFQAQKLSSNGARWLPADKKREYLARQWAIYEDMRSLNLRGIAGIHRRAEFRRPK
jgi:hypothetical protein